MSDMTRALMHRVHAVKDRQTLCGHEVVPARWIDLGELTLIFQLTCMPCSEELFKRDLVKVDGSISNG